MRAHAEENKMCSDCLGSSASSNRRIVLSEPGESAVLLTQPQLLHLCRTCRAVGDSQRRLSSIGSDLWSTVMTGAMLDSDVVDGVDESKSMVVVKRSVVAERKTKSGRTVLLIAQPVLAELHSRGASHIEVVLPY